MTKAKLDKIKRMKTIHVWPAILGFLLSLGLLVGLVMACVSVALLYVLENEYSKKYEAVAYISDLVEEDYRNNISFEESLEKINRDQICIINPQNEILAGKGDIDIEFTSELEVDIVQNRTFYSGVEENLEWFDEDGEISPDIIALVSKMTEHPYYGEEWIEDILYSVDCWMVMPAEIGEDRLLIRSEVQIVRKDILFILSLAAIIVIIVLIPLFAMLSNVFSSVKAQNQMRRLMNLDETTGGNNWTYFKENAKKVILKRRNRTKFYAVVDLEFMKYRSFCACCGVDEGERVLEIINDRVSANLGRKGICARYARANFALLIPGRSKEELRERLEKIVGSLSNVAGNQRAVFHAGYYVINEVSQTYDNKNRRSIDIPSVYNSASAARASIATAENNMIAEFSDKLLEDQIWEHKVENEMYSALMNREFVVYYQPKYNPITEKLAGAEALIRWVKDGSLVPPGKFIPIFEKNGFITKIDDYMIDNVARQQAQWLKEGRNIVPVSVNVSRAHFTQEDLAEHILEIVDKYDIEHKYIEIELTESAFFDDKKALLGTVKKLKEYGFEISMDDFGAGYSSLNSLKDLPLDVLKLDADFFRGEENNERADIVVTEAITLAKQLDMRIVAEGIEKKQQVDFLANVGCDMIQGYYFAKPMPANEYEERMA